MAYNKMNQAHGRHDGVNWSTVALYGGGAAVGAGMIRAGGRGIKNKLQSKGMSNLFGLQGGANMPNYGRAGAAELGAMGVGSKEGYRPGARNIALNRRTALNQFREEVGRPASRTPAGSAHAKDIRGLYGNQLKDHVSATRTKNLLGGGEGMKGGAMRGAAAAYGWASAADFGKAAGGTGGWARVGASGARMGMVGLGVGLASKGLDWMFD